MGYKFKKMKWHCRRKKCMSCKKPINTGKLVIESSSDEGKFLHKDCFESLMSKDKPKPETIQKRFIRFLKEYEVYDQYIANWDKKRKQPIKNKLYYVGLAFHWNKTPQIYEFWYSVDRKWKEILKKEGWQNETIRPFNNTMAYLNSTNGTFAPGNSISTIKLYGWKNSRRYF